MSKSDNVARRDAIAWPQRFNLDRPFEEGFGYGRWRDARDGAYAIVPYCSGSDYSGSLVERSNRDVWRETFADGEDLWWSECHGGHGTFAIVVEISALPEDAIELIEGLEGYPLADEDHHSTLEIEAQDRAWDDWTRRDFARAVAARFDVETDLDEPDAHPTLWEVFREASDRANVYWENQQGDEMWIDLDRVVAAVESEDLARILAAVPQ